jgi:hypothetical protein
MHLTLCERRRPAKSSPAFADLDTPSGQERPAGCAGYSTTSKTAAAKSATDQTRSRLTQPRRSTARPTHS